MKTFLLSIGFLAATSAMGQTISSFPYTEDFEGEGTGSTACGATYTMLTPGWINDAADDIDWTADIGGTGSFGTGPQDNSDFNPGTTTGHYLYTEASGCAGTTANLESVWFDFSAITSGMEMTFAYHMLGDDMGTLAVEVRTGMTAPWTTLLAAFTDNFDGWQQSMNDITPYVGEDSVQFRFVGTTGPSFESDMCIDDINVYATAFTGSIGSIVNETCFAASNGSITAINSYGVDPISYLWDTGDPADTLATLSDIGPGTYCCTMIDANDDTVIVCGDIIALATAPLNAYVHAVDEWICADSTGLIVIDSITGGAPTAINCGISPIGCTGPTDTLQIDVQELLVGGTQYPSPLGNWYWGTRHQILYTAADLTSAGIVPGNLSGLAFYIDNLGTADPNLTAFIIKVGCTTATSITAFDDAGPAEVYPATDVTIAVGWNWYDFADDFYWNGVDNIIVETCFNNAGFTNNPQMACAVTAASSVVYYRADSPTVCGSSLITGTSVNRPIIQFKNCSATPAYPYIYSWDMGSSADTTVVPGGTYTLTVEDGTGCIITEDVTVNESAPVNIDDMTICETNPTDFSASSTFDSYTWSTGESGQTISITTGGTYYVDAIDSLGCPTSDTAFVSTIPVPVISATSSDVMFGSDGYIDLLVYGAAFPFTIDWDNDGTGDDDDTEDQFGLDAGDFTVVVTDTNGCWSTLTVTVGSQLGIGNETLSTFLVFPNPTDGVVNIQPYEIQGDHAYGEILDLTGRVIERFSFAGKNTVQIDLSNQENGTYFVRLTVDGAQTTTKLVVQ